MHQLDKLTVTNYQREPDCKCCYMYVDFQILLKLSCIIAVDALASTFIKLKLLKCCLHMQNMEYLVHVSMFNLLTC